MIAVSEERAAEIIPERPAKEMAETIPGKPTEETAEAIPEKTPEEAAEAIPEKTPEEAAETIPERAPEETTDAQPAPAKRKRRLRKEVIWALHGILFTIIALLIGARVFATPLYETILIEVGSEMPEAYEFSPRQGARISYASDAETDAYLSRHADVDGTPVDLNRTGVYTVFLKCGRDVRTSHLIVQDTTPPVIAGAEDKTVSAGEVIDFTDGVRVTDNHDSDIALHVEADTVNTEKPGTYIAIYHAADAAGNEASTGIFVHVTDAETREDGIKTIPQSASIEGVIPLNQYPDLPTGCEVTSLAMALTFAGYDDVDAVTLAKKHLPKGKMEDKHANPYEVFIGDPEDPGSFGCYAPVIVTCAERFGAEAEDISACSLDTMLSYVAEGTPVIVWATSGMVKTAEGTYRYTRPDGEEENWKNMEHCLLMTGYDINENTVQMADPEKGELVTYRMTVFLKRWEEQGCQAVVVN